MDQSIPLAQKIYFLGIHPEKGGINSSTLDYVVLGALFMELYLNGHIKFDQKRIVVQNTNAGNCLHRYVLDKMKKARSPRTISTWINQLSYSLKYIRKEVQSGLVSRRLIHMEIKQFLFFKWKKPRIINRQVLCKLEHEIRHVIFNGTDEEEKLLLLSFLEPGGLLYRLFPDRKKRKEAKQMLKQMMAKNSVSGAVADAISASQAVAASVAISVAATS